MFAQTLDEVFDGIRSQWIGKRTDVAPIACQGIVLASAIPIVALSPSKGRNAGRKIPKGF